MPKTPLYLRRKNPKVNQINKVLRPFNKFKIKYTDLPKEHKSQILQKYLDAQREEVLEYKLKQWMKI